MPELDAEAVHEGPAGSSTDKCDRPMPQQRAKTASQSKMRESKLELKRRELSKMDDTCNGLRRQVDAVVLVAPSAERVRSAAEERMWRLRERTRAKEGALAPESR